MLKIPLYLSGAIRKELVGRPEFGYMRTPVIGNRPDPSVTWFADNGCFSKKGERAFNLESYLAWLRNQEISTCIGANAPDKVGDAVETLSRSLSVLPLIRGLGYKASFVAQDGIEKTAIPWDDFDALFIGGTTDWKLGPIAAGVATEAISRGKWLHMGRVNSYKRYLYSALLGCDSVDGTFLAFGPAKNLPRLEKWVASLKAVQAGGSFNENDLPVWWNQQALRQRGDGLARGHEDGIVPGLSVS